MIRSAENNLINKLKTIYVIILTTFA